MEARTVNGPAYTRTNRERLAGAFVLAILVLACVTFWIGVPLGVLWALSKATEDEVVHFVGGLIGVPVAMALFSPAAVLAQRPLPPGHRRDRAGSRRTRRRPAGSAGCAGRSSRCSCSPSRSRSPR